MFYKNKPAFPLQLFVETEGKRGSRMCGKKLLVAASFVTILILLSGCGLWGDFTTYFNTYYNAKTLFDNIEEQIKSQRKDIFAFREDIQKNSTLGLNTNQFQNLQQTNTFNQNLNQTINRSIGQTTNPNAGSGNQLSGQLNQDLTRVIEKCSKILQYEIESSYFPDALFIIGKALYYQQEYARSQRKFLELAALEKTKYALENNLWLAKTYLQLRSFDEGLKLIDSVRVESQKEGKDKIFIDASITKISFFLYREDYPKAVDECINFIAHSPDEEMTALVSFELGRIYETLRDYNKALDAFASVKKYSPSFEIEFKSRLEQARLLKKLNRIDDAEAELNNLRYSGKFRNNLDEVMIELGQIYVDKNQIKTAISTYLEVDSTFKQTQSAGIAEFRLADLYEKKVRDYDSSYKYYNKAAGSLAPPEIKVESSNRTRNIDKYNQLKNSIVNYSLSQIYLSNPSRFERDSVDYDMAYKEYMDEARRMLEEQRAQAGQTETNQIGFNREQNQGQLLIYQQKIIAKAYQDLRQNKQLTLSQLIAINKVQKPVKPKMSADSIKTLESRELYNLASLFFSELDVPDSAYFYFRKILSEYPTKPVSVQTMYALGTYYETVNDTLKADSLYRYIYNNFVKDPLRMASAQKLGLIKNEEKRSVVVKTDDDPARQFYLDAENKYFDKKYNEAIEGFQSVYKNYPKSSYAPKSIYYIGLIYEDNLQQYDSAAVTYGMLVSNYRTSPLTTKIMEKYTYYQTERVRQKTIQEEKLRAEQTLQPNKTKDETANQNPKPTKTEIGPAKPAVADTLSDSIKNRKPNRSVLDEQKLKSNSDSTMKTKKVTDWFLILFLASKKLLN